MNIQHAFALLFSALVYTIQGVPPTSNGDRNDLGFGNGTGRPAFTEAPDNTGGYVIFPSQGGSNKPLSTK